MIKLERVRTTEAITSGMRGTKRVNKNLLLLRGTQNGNLKFTKANSYWKPAKPQLRAEAQGKCAYCEALTAVVAHGDVEHFRPKSIYWWLAYCYDNFLFSCQICNESFKGDQFPLHDTAFPAPALPAVNATEAQLRTSASRFSPDPLNDAEGLPMADFLAALKSEKAALPNPYLIDPEPFFKWEADPVNKEVSLKPRNTTLACRRAFAAADKVLGLNREELRRTRWLEYRKLETFKQSFLSPQIDAVLRAQIKNMLEAMTDASAPFAGMARYFVKVEWQL